MIYKKHFFLNIHFQTCLANFRNKKKIVFAITNTAKPEIGKLFEEWNLWVLTSATVLVLLPFYK